MKKKAPLQRLAAARRAARTIRTTRTPRPFLERNVVFRVQLKDDDPHAEWTDITRLGDENEALDKASMLRLNFDGKIARVVRRVVSDYLVTWEDDDEGDDE